MSTKIISADQQAKIGSSPWTLQTVVDALRRRALLALATFIAVAILCFIAVALLPVRYTATALVLVDNTEARLLDVGDGTPDLVMAPNIIETQSEIARSPEILATVIEELDLARDPEFLYQPSAVNRVLGALGLSAASIPEEYADGPAAAMARTAVVDNLERVVNVRRRGVTNVIGVAVQSRDSVKAATIANAIARAYIDSQSRQKSAVARSAANVLRARVSDLADTIRVIEEQLGGFVASAAEAYGSPADRMTIRQLTGEIQRESQVGTSHIATISALEDFQRSGDSTRLPATLGAAQDLSGLAARRAELVAAQQDGGASAGELARINGELDQLNNQLQTSVQASVSSLRSEMEAANSRVATLRTQLDQQLGSINLPNSAAVQYYTLQRDAKSNQDLYEVTLQRLRDLEQQAEFAAPDSRLVSSALVPNRISFPPVALLLAMSVLLAGAAGATAAVYRDRYMGGFTSARQIAELTGAEVLATIPRHEPRSVMFVNTLLGEPLSAYAEAFRRLKLSIDVMLGYPATMVVMITSTTAREGKSTISLALAETFAQSGRKTLLIDADMRKPSIAGMLGFEPKRGLVDLLSSSEPAPDAIIPDARYSSGRLSLLLGRAVSGVPTDWLVDSDRFKAFVAGARSAYEVIIIDTPPIGHVVDARIISRSADLTVYVAQWGEVNQMSVLEGLKELSRGSASRTAMVLSQSDDRRLFSNAGYYTE